MRAFLAILSVLLLTVASNAQSIRGVVKGQPISIVKPALSDIWKIEEVTDGSVPSEIVPDKRENARNGLPDGKIAVPENKKDIAEAWYSEPTKRYRHGVLGDATEAAALVIKTPRGAKLTYRLPSTEVFEDITPRLVDLDRDGKTEVVTILSSSREGASIAVFGLVGNALIKKAQGPFIGRSNRWLNIAGIARFTGLRNLEIAAVEMPHLAGLLKFYRYRNGKLDVSRYTPGFSNHEIGSGELRLSSVALVDDDNRPDLIVPNSNRNELLIVSFVSGTLKLLSRIKLPAAIDKAILVEGSGRDLKVTVGLSDGRIFKLSR